MASLSSLSQAKGSLWALLQASRWIHGQTVGSLSDQWGWGGVQSTQSGFLTLVGMHSPQSQILFFSRQTSGRWDNWNNHFGQPSCFEPVVTEEAV